MAPRADYRKRIQEALINATFLFNIVNAPQLRNRRRQMTTPLRPPSDRHPWRYTAPVLLGMALLGCGSAATSPPVPEPQVSPGLSADSDKPLAAPPTEGTAAAALEDEDSIYFASGATRVDAAGQQKLRRHAARLQENPAQVLTLVGHTDDVGSSSYNLAVAEQRIEAVARLLRAYGVPRKQMHPVRSYVVGAGKSAPSCRTAACRQKMRRVELIYAH